MANSSDPLGPGGSGGRPRPAPGDDAAPGTTGAGENLCPRCNGSGRLDNKPCPTCEGTGKVIEGIGGG
jgi:hypothetical protein